MIYNTEKIKQYSKGSKMRRWVLKKKTLRNAISQTYNEKQRNHIFKKEMQCR